jgi:hypothetical protein
MADDDTARDAAHHVADCPTARARRIDECTEEYRPFLFGD